MIWILLAAYNEEEALRRFLPRLPLTLQGRNSCVVLVDDGSTDLTGESLTLIPSSEFLDTRLLRHPSNRGLGAALKTGFQEILKHARPEDVIVTLDADNTHSLEVIPQLAEKMSEGADIVVASRYCDGARVFGLGFLRRLGSWGINRVLAVFFPYPGLRDYTSGLRAFRVGFLLKSGWGGETVLLRESGFAGTPEILIRSLSSQPVIQEVPITLRYDQKPTPSKMRILQTLFHYARLMIDRWRGKP